ncbi:superoxide dismutase [Lineolata rhizophorae]|uniref:Superoxide dismutase 1 copper chaperone n=1 Tax=Lineolata rhizophorae TaxID=578093 RepID=A0A6A6P1A6_9PEZI|nr:superoxide dismutase [Lineolata rhizophorae]
MIPPFQTTFAVPLSCESCIRDVSTSLYKLDGINKVDADLKQQIVSIEGNAPPSAIVSAIQATGRDAILRGSGKPDTAAVCILETHASSAPDNKVRGLARMVQVAANTTVVDLSVRGLAPGRYHASVRETGDISSGPESVGGVWGSGGGGPDGGPPSSPPPPAKASARGIFGTVTVGAGGVGAVFLDRPVQVWEMVGRAMVVSRRAPGERLDKEDPDTLVGVVARSAGVWDNDKTVCSCSGKTVWEERREQVDRGML